MTRARWYRWLAVPVVALVVSAGTPADAAPIRGADVSFPQCGYQYPAGMAFGLVGVNDGEPDTANPCLASEYRWAQSTGTAEFYMNTANTVVSTGGAYAGGYDAARSAYSYASSVGPGSDHLWWLDVETANSWSADLGANTASIAGAIAFLRAQGVVVGIYSTNYQWAIITGGARIPSVANWVPGAQSAAAAPAYCAASRSFSGGPVAMAQYTTNYDYDYLCPGVALPPPIPPASLLPNLLNAVLHWLNSL